jgi:hypothetical protein
MRLFVAVNDWTWSHQPGIDDAEATVLAIAGGELDETGTAAWLRQFLMPPSRTP